MIRFMLDTDRLDKLSNHFELQMTYADLVTDYHAISLKYPQSKIVLIDRGLGDPTGLASVFDIEKGALTIDQAIAKYDEQKAKGIPYLTAYHDRADTVKVEQAFGNRTPFHGIATLDGTAHITGFTPLFTPAFIQCLSSAELGYHADGSLVLEDAWNPTRFPQNLAAARGDIATAIAHFDKGLADTREGLMSLHHLVQLLGA